MRRGGAALGLLLLSGAAFAADPVRAYAAPDGSVRLWLRGAPSVTAVDQAGWQIAPKAAETNATWLDRLKKIYPEEPGSPWKPLLEDVRATTARDGVQMVSPSGTITVGAPQNGKVTVTVGTATAAFTQSGEKWTSSQVGTLDAWVKKTAPGANSLAPLYRFAAQSVPVNPTAAEAWSVFLAAAVGSTTTKPLVFEGIQPVVVELKPPAPVAIPPKKTETPKTEPKVEAKPTGSVPMPLVGLGVVAALGIGFGLGYFLRPKAAAAVPPSDGALKQRIANNATEVERLIADLERAKASLAEANRASKQYRDEHNTWLRDRDETVRTLQEERNAHATHAGRAAELAGLLKATEDAKNRTEGELAKQIQALQGKVQSQESRAAALATRARAYTALHREIMDAFNFLQGEIGRPEVAAVVGYLLNYSVANLMDTLLAPNPALERAMLSNISRIAGCVSNLPHVRKAASTAEGLLTGLGLGAISESATPHPYATHIGGLLRIVRNQMNVEVAPFYVAVDGDGKAHAVYI
jgi:F0F1-type ATP synthase membrane subunit b/b'